MAKLRDSVNPSSFLVKLPHISSSPLFAMASGPDLGIIYMALCYSFLILGNVTLFVLLLTFWRVRSLSQRNNPFLINLLLTTWLSTIPASLM